MALDTLMARHCQSIAVGIYDMVWVISSSMSKVPVPDV